MTFFFLIFFLFLLFLLLYLKKIEFRYSKSIFLFLFLFLFLIVGLRENTVDHDYGNYLDAIKDNTGSIGEPSFLFFSFLIKKYHLPYTFLFLIYAFIGIGLKFYAIHKYSLLPTVSLLIYFSNFLLLHDINQIRAGVSSGILLLSLPLLVRKEYKKYFVLCIIAFLFHFSSLIFFALFFFKNTPFSKKERLWWAILPFIFLIFHEIDFVVVLSYIPFDFIRDKLYMYVSLQEAGVEGFAQVNLFNPYFLFKYMIYCYFLYRYNFYFLKYPYFPILLKIFGISLISFYLFSIITPIAGYRISELLGVVEILLFPLLFTVIKTDVVKKHVVIFYVFLLLSVNLFHKTMIYI